ncbi:MAG: transglycosylase domain-containing protein [Anaerolineae bacterium]|nr:transglycosylase domain-containing protein [Anaerolineae bacterium]
MASKSSKRPADGEGHMRDGRLSSGEGATDAGRPRDPWQAADLHPRAAHLRPRDQGDDAADAGDESTFVLPDVPTTSSEDRTVAIPVVSLHEDDPNPRWMPTQRIPLQPGAQAPARAAEPTRLVPTWRGIVAADDSDTQPIRPVQPPAPPPSPPRRPPARRSPRKRDKGPRWASILLGVTLTGVGLFLLGLVAGAIGYVYLAAQLPSPDELRERQPNFASSQIYDRNGLLLHEIIDPTAGKRTYVSIGHISPHLKLATVATEDRNFYQHGGFDPIAIARAVYYALQEREIVSGASTITQQVARNILLGPDAMFEQTASRKIKEIILAAELTRRYSKDDILEIYVNNNNYGNLAYGVDAAARTYFGTNAAQLTLSQASFLAGLPQSPAVYDPFRGGREAALKRHKVVLGLMVEDGYITIDQAVAAAAEMDAYEFKPIYTDRIPAPHFVVYVTQWVEKALGAEALYTGSGLRIHTTLDPRLQRIAEEEVARGVVALADRNVTNGALVAIEPSSGHILAMVGSADFYDNELGGQVNVILRCRQPGSAIKPLTYLKAFEEGWTPATTVWDLPVSYTDTAGNVYEPVNYDGRFRGPVSVRTALANSLNVPAVKTLEYVTVDGLLEIAGRLGADSLVAPQDNCPDYPYENRPLYGLALTLGGGEMKPLELTSAYATLSNGGLRMPPTPILWVEDQSGNVLIDNRRRRGEQVVDPELAYLITHILSDTKARCLVFSCPSVLELADRPVAAKTGSTNDTRDAWTVGYTPDIAAGVWVGNNDNTPMADVLGSLGAAPIWQAFMARAHEGVPVHGFPRPAGVTEREICVLSGTEPSPSCAETRVEVFSVDNLPPRADQDWLQEAEIDVNSGLLANAYCRDNVVSKPVVFLDRVQDPQGQAWLAQWAAERNIAQAPTAECTSAEQPPEVKITSPASGDEVYGYAEIYGSVDMADFDRYEIGYGVGSNPQGWEWVSGPHLSPVRDGMLGVWQIPAEFTPGVATLRVVAYNKQGARFEARQLVRVIGPTPTPTPEATSTGTPTLTPTLTPTPKPTDTPVATDTLTPTPTESVGDATSTPTIGATPIQSATPSLTATSTSSSDP